MAGSRNTRLRPHTEPFSVDRRTFLQATAAGGLALATTPIWADAVAEKAPETLVGELFKNLTEEQRKKVCFDWNHVDPQRGLLRTRVANNWRITDPIVSSEFYTDDQRDLIKAIFEGIVRPEWHERMYRQMDDDAGGFGEEQAIAIFGVPGSDKFEYVFTGRHMTLRCDGNTAEHVAFGGPIFYGHDTGDFDEGPKHEGNVFWSQALEANRIYEMLDGKQRKLAEVAQTPQEQKVAFRGSKGDFMGIPVTELSDDQKTHLQDVLKKLVEPYRQTDQDEAMACLKSQGGLDRCHLAFFTDNDIGDDKVWDNWRIEGPSFVWHFRGAPHVHVWVNIADSADVKLNA